MFSNFLLSKLLQIHVVDLRRLSIVAFTRRSLNEGQHDVLVGQNDLVLAVFVILHCIVMYF